MRAVPTPITQNQGTCLISIFYQASTNSISSEQIHDSALIDYCNEGQRWDPVLSANFYRFDPDTFKLTTLAPPNQADSSPVSPPYNLTSWFYYTGHWGDMRYPDSDPRQETIPRFGLKRFETGPNGPRFKHLVRKGLLRDEARQKSWVEWAVGLYMSWYPCCIRGWRKWFSIAIITLAFVAVGWCLMTGIAKYRSRRVDYTKLEQAEDIPLDEWVMDDDVLLSSDDEIEETRH